MIIVSNGEDGDRSHKRDLSLIFNVSIPALDGCFTQGKDEKGTLKNAREAIKCYLEGMEKVIEIKTKP